MADLLPPVEDADEPVTAHRDIELDLAEYKGHPPDNVRAWLDERGVKV